ncbi:MAG TPA: hypothetical protein VFR24_00010 [Candidatus Angelobacter sp.]|nr:hypothetical protein [Candidatus Angelobacter sp.]
MPWLDETQDWGPPALASLDPRPDQPHPKNAPGDFYVLNGECIACGMPHCAAPELIEWDVNSQGDLTHCFFRKQPETALELVHAVKAIEGSCCGAVRYRGSDPAAIEKLRWAGCENAIDRS